MKNATCTFALFMLAMGCTVDMNEDPGTMEAAALAPTARIATSLMVPVTDDGTPDRTSSCVIGRQFHLLSVGEALRVASTQVPLVGCNAVLVPPKYRDYKVESVTFRAGTKTFFATGQYGTVELIDNRLRVAPDRRPLEAKMVEIVRRDGPDRGKESLFAGTMVDDRNLKASGDAYVDVLVEMKTGHAYEEMTKLTFSLLNDSKHTGPLDDGLTWQLRVVSDLEAQHVVNQLTVLDRVKNVSLLQVSDDPWPPPR